LNKSKDVYIELEWNEEDIVTWDEFEMTIRAFNLKDYNYDVKAYIELDDGTTISERYDEDRGWVSGVYFFNGFFSGNGNKSNKLRMQIKKDYENFSGDANIFGKIRKNDKILYEIEDEIVIIGKNKTQKTSTDTYVSSNSASDNANLQTESDSSGSVIDLRSKNANINKNTANSIIYKSRTEYIKEYAYYAFGLLCLLLIIVYIISRIKRKKK
jgi:hypothetical protein